MFVLETQSGHGVKNLFHAILSLSLSFPTLRPVGIAARAVERAKHTKSISVHEGKKHQ